MNGAMAEPLVSTIRPPKITIMMKIGSSQNFLRSRMNAQSSTMMEPMVFKSLSRSELIFHRLRRRPRRGALDPVALGVLVQAQAQEILARRPHHKADRRDRHKEQQAHDERVHHLEEQQAKLQPKPVERAQDLGKGERHHQENGRDRQRVVPVGMAAPPRQGGQNREETRENKAKATVGAGLDVFFARKILMKLAGRHDAWIRS